MNRQIAVLGLGRFGSSVVEDDKASDTGRRCCRKDGVDPADTVTRGCKREQQ